MSARRALRVDDAPKRVRFIDGSTPQVIELLEAFLAQARVGNCPAIAVASGHPDGRAGSAWIVGRGGSLTVLQGELTYMVHKLNVAMDEEEARHAAAHDRDPA